ncbi:hypothetical protein ABS71_18620 [bacterium SCN 62-11]|nr:hypothetical protein [Candidatus Eremiobacteraeota bacterium]ODT58705.1 MAG: hypothetical protein ABS71_18620 [bacterium SCN 62-11]
MSWRDRFSKLQEQLSEVSDRDLQSLLLEVFAQRVPQPGYLQQRYQESRFVHPSPLNVRKSARLLAQAWETLPEPFEPIELSPLAPLGTCAGLATVSQNKVVSTGRNCEVSADPSPVLALECARRKGPVDLAAYQRVVRAQALPGPGFYAHFGIFSLVSAGRHGFEEAAIQRHWDFYRKFLESAVPDARVEFQLTNWGNLKLQAGFVPDWKRQPGYYQKACFKIYLNGVEVGDGGFTDWMARLRSDRRESFLSSGLGWERLVGLMH